MADASLSVVSLADDPLYVELRRATLQRIVDHYDAIEFDIANMAIADFKTLAQQKGLSSWITAGRDETTNQLRISVLKDPSREALREHSTEVLPLGRWRVAVVESDFLSPASLRRYSERFAALVARKYDALVMAVEIHSKETSAHSLDACRGIVMTALRRDSRVDYYSDCWLIASDQDSGTLLLSEEILHRALMYFRSHLEQTMSPLEMLLSLLRTKFPYKDTLSFVAHRKGSTRLIGTFRNAKYKQSAMDLWLAIGTLHDFEDFGVVPLATAGSNALTLGCKARVLDEALRCLEPHRATIEAEFRRGADHFTPLILPARSTSVHAAAAFSAGVKVSGLAHVSSYNVFISYSKTDRDIVQVIQSAMAPSIDSGLVELFFDELIEKGQRWESSLTAMIDRADAGVFLVSVASLASPTIMKMELPLMRKRVDTRDAVLRWLPLQHCLWQETPFAELQASWSPSKPLRSMTPTDHDKAIQSVCRDIVRLAKASLRP